VRAQVELDGVRTTLAARMFLTTQIIPVVRSTAPPDNTTQAVTTVPAGPTTFGCVHNNAMRVLGQRATSIAADALIVAPA